MTATNRQREILEATQTYCPSCAFPSGVGLKGCWVDGELFFTGFLPCPCFKRVLLSPENVSWRKEHQKDKTKKPTAKQLWYIQHKCCAELWEVPPCFSSFWGLSSCAWNSCIIASTGQVAPARHLPLTAAKLKNMTSSLIVQKCLWVPVSPHFTFLWCEVKAQFKTAEWLFKVCVREIIFTAIKKYSHH